MTSRPAGAADPRALAPSDSTPPDHGEQALAQLQQKMQSLPTIEQAKGILMARFELDADAAFALLVRWSQASNLKLRVICTSLVEASGRAGALDAVIAGLQHGRGGTDQG